MLTAEPFVCYCYLSVTDHATVLQILGIASPGLTIHQVTTTDSRQNNKSMWELYHTNDNAARQNYNIPMSLKLNYIYQMQSFKMWLKLLIMLEICSI